MLFQEILEQLKSIQEQGLGEEAVKKPISAQVREVSSDAGGFGMVAQQSGQKGTPSWGFYLMIVGYVVYYTWSQ